MRFGWLAPVCEPAYPQFGADIKYRKETNRCCYVPFICVAYLRARFARTLPNRRAYGVAYLLVGNGLRVRQC